MNTEWQVKPLSRKSSLSGELFASGSKITSYIYTNPENVNELLRADILDEESANWVLPKNIVAHWTRLIRDSENDEQKEAQRQTLSNAEEFFISLYNESEENTKVMATRDTLKQFLGLMLERKRILRRLNKKSRENILYLHVSTRQEYAVPKTPLSLEEIERIQNQLTVLIT